MERFFRSQSPMKDDGLSLQGKINKSIQKAKNHKMRKPINMVILYLIFILKLLFRSLE